MYKNILKFITINEFILHCVCKGHSTMYGIPDFEAKIDAIPDSELTPHLSTELGRIPWLQERQEFMPKPFRDQKFVYKGDRLSDLLVGHQERAQAFRNRLMVYFYNLQYFYQHDLE